MEDRGPLGWRGARIVRVRPLFDGMEDADFSFEMPADELTLAE